MITLSDFRDDGTGNIVLRAGECAITVTPMNIDDIFREARRQNIKEIEVTNDEMFIIATFLVANISPYFDMEYTREEAEKKALLLMKEGKVDKFFGVKLVLQP